MGEGTDLLVAGEQELLSLFERDLVLPGDGLEGFLEAREKILVAMAVDMATRKTTISRAFLKALEEAVVAGLLPQETARGLLGRMLCFSQ